MKFSPLFTLHSDEGERLEIGDVPTGKRIIFTSSGGNFVGERLKGKVLDNGGDWLLIDKNGFGHIDGSNCIANG